VGSFPHLHRLGFQPAIPNLGIPLTVLFAIPTAVALSQWIGVFGWGWPNSSRVNRKIMPSLQFKKRAPSSASAAEATTKRRMAHNVKNAPFNLMGSPSLGVQGIGII
jgi:hypothetical protein